MCLTMMKRLSLTLLLAKPPSIRLDTPQTKVAKQPHCSKHVKKNTKKRKRKLTIGDHVIANVITKIFDNIKEIIKLKW